jgi:hypothetical protein
LVVPALIGLLAAPPRVSLAAEGLDEALFAAFRRAFLAADRQSSARVEGECVDLSVPGLAAPSRLTVDLRTEKRLAIDGADPAAQTGILNINGRDLGAARLPLFIPLP